MENGCSEIAYFQTEVLDRMNEQSTVTQLATVLSLHGTNHFSFFVAGIDGVAEFPCVIIWDLAFVMLSESLGSSSQIEALIAKFPKKLTELSSSTSHMIFGFPGESETRESWLVSMLFQVCFRVLIRESFVEHFFV